ncbi:uncharacterized protein LOC108471331 [Gossypium arboreum]|uniref:uncharacterized protein LOC108471331 n=1 Tax=Gossypium arboreum TaxID=29729 RepID=UPI0008195E28|nr:uncharacterized protein LOC108471331 [Gossypium arboreum]
MKINYNAQEIKEAPKKMGFSFKSITCEKDEGSSNDDDDEEMVMFAKKFKKFMKFNKAKRFPRKDIIKGEPKEEKVVPDEFFRLMEQEKKLIKPYWEGTYLINLGDDKVRKEIRIETTLMPKQSQLSKDLLIEFSDVFAWSYQDMPGLDTNIVEHMLPLKLDCEPIYQKLRRMKPDMLLKIKEEVKKQFDARFLEVAKYSEVMPFDLKNAGATYQQAIVTLFHDMMHKEIEVYVDDMIAKSAREESHVENLCTLFERLRKYKLRLNPTKCTFGVKLRKLLGFVVSEQGLEIDPDKVRAIQDLTPLKT